MRSLASVLAALWAGSLCTICCVVAPTLFVALPDRQLAGATAAQFFRIVSMIGLAIGALLLILMLVGKLQLPRRWGFALVIATAALPIVSELALGPLMSSARAAGDMGRFGMLHGVAALFFFAACLGAIAVVVLISRSAR